VSNHVHNTAAAFGRRENPFRATRPDHHVHTAAKSQLISHLYNYKAVDWNLFVCLPSHRVQNAKKSPNVTVPEYTATEWADCVCSPGNDTICVEGPHPFAHVWPSQKTLCARTFSPVSPLRRRSLLKKT